MLEPISLGSWVFAISKSAILSKVISERDMIQRSFLIVKLVK